MMPLVGSAHWQVSSIPSIEILSLASHGLYAFTAKLNFSWAVVALKHDNQSSQIVVDRVYKNFESLTSDYIEGALHPGDLKEGLKRSLNAILDPVRKHFETDASAKDLLKKVKQYRTTR